MTIADRIAEAEKIAEYGKKLRSASEKGSLGDVRAILRICPECINEVDNDERTALMEAAYKGHAEIVEELIKAGANLDEKSLNKGSTALMQAVLSASPSIEAIKALIKAGAKLDEKSNAGNTALICAADYGMDEFVKVLVAAGAGVNVQNKRGEDALVYATRGGHSNAAKILEAAGAKLDEKEKNAQKILEVAAYGERLRNASELGILKDVRAILKACPECINEKNEEGNTALMRAAAYYRSTEEVLKELINAGAKLEEKNNNGSTALIEAAGNGRIEFVKELIKAGAKLDIQNKGGDTALMWAVFCCGAQVFNGWRFGVDIIGGRYEVVKELINAGAKLNEKCCNGKTALMEAACNGLTSIVKILLAAGVDSTIKHKGKKVVALEVNMFASEKDKRDCVQLLKDAENGILPTCEEVGILPREARVSKLEIERSWTSRVTAEVGKNEWVIE